MCIYVYIFRVQRSLPTTFADVIDRWVLLAKYHDVLSGQHNRKSECPTRLDLAENDRMQFDKEFAWEVATQIALRRGQIIAFSMVTLPRLSTVSFALELSSDMNQKISMTPYLRLWSH